MPVVLTRLIKVESLPSPGSDSFALLYEFQSNQEQVNEFESYKNTIKYFSHLIELAGKENQIISYSMNECITLVNKRGNVG